MHQLPPCPEQLTGQPLIEGPRLGPAVVPDVEFAARAARPDRPQRLSQRFDDRHHPGDIRLRLLVLLVGLESRIP